MTTPPKPRSPEAEAAYDRAAEHVRTLKARAEVRTVPLPASWYMGGHGDPIASFDRLLLDLHPDGGVTWRQVDLDGNAIAGAPLDE